MGAIAISGTSRFNLRILLIITTIIITSGLILSIIIPCVIHGNCDSNPDSHQVYEIFAIEPTGYKRVLKYGITSQTNFITMWGNPRPEYQKRYFQTLPEYSDCIVNYIILYPDVQGRIAAKQLEQELVNQYFMKYGVMPERQIRPAPSFP